MIVEYERWRLQPYSNGLCWEVLEHREVKPKDKEREPYMDWVSVGKYPSTFGHGLAIVYELALKAGADVVPLVQAMGRAKRIEATLMKTAKGA